MGFLHCRWILYHLSRQESPQYMFIWLICFVVQQKQNNSIKQLYPNKKENKLLFSWKNKLFIKGHFWWASWSKDSLIQVTPCSQGLEQHLLHVSEVRKLAYVCPSMFVFLRKWTFVLLGLWFSLWLWLWSADFFDSTLDWKDCLMGPADQNYAN